MSDIKTIICERVVDGSAEFGIRKTDEMDNLECFCSDNPPENDFEIQIRGYIFDNNNKLILKSLPYAVEEFDSVENLSDYIISDMQEGTAIRVFYYNNKWYITTHRKLDAYKSKWGNESFGDIFEAMIIKTFPEFKTLDLFLNYLDKEYSYVFLVGTTEHTRIVSPAYNGIKLLATLTTDGDMVSVIKFKKWYQRILQFSNKDEVVKYVENLSYPFEKITGVFLYSQNFKCVKLFNSQYKELSLLRNNLPSVKYAYLHNVFDKEKKEMFRKIYSNFKADFDFYDQEIEDIIKNLSSLYIKRFVLKQKFIVSKHEHNILRNIHAIYFANRKVITNEDIRYALKTGKPTYINKILTDRKIALKKEVKC
nr:MAG: immediate early protein [Diabrotica toursvirus 3a]